MVNNLQPLFKKGIFLFFVILMATGCSGEVALERPDDLADVEPLYLHDGRTASAPEVSLTPVAEFGEVGDVLYRTISAAAVTKSGRVFLADQNEGVVHAYEPGGTYIRQVGGKGEGPGEFRTTTNIHVHGDELIVLDVNTRRLSFFDAETLEFDRAVALEGSGETSISSLPIGVRPVDEEKLVVLTSRFTMSDGKASTTLMPVVIDREGTVLNRPEIDVPATEMLMLQSDNSINMFSLPYNERGILGLLGRDRFFTANSARFYLRIYDLEGTFQYAIYYHMPTIPVAFDRLMSDYEPHVRQSAREAGVPEQMPVLSTITADEEGRFWVGLPNEEDAEQTYWILSTEGELLATATLDENDRIYAFQDGHVYLLTLTDEGLPLVVKNRYQLP
ncbi:MAG: 6-bladed beta-propeller [Balneolaceae bacterium]